MQGTDVEQFATEAASVPTDGGDGDPTVTYRARCARFAAERDRYARLGSLNANLNVALFLAAPVLIGLGIWGARAWLVVLVLDIVAFVAAYLSLGRLNRLRDRYDLLWRINDEGLHRIARAWDALPAWSGEPIPAEHPYGADLDLAGRASLLHLLGTATTPGGRTTLRGWLLAPATPGEARERQSAVAELAPLNEPRDALALNGRLMAEIPGAEAQYGTFLSWAEDADWLAPRPWLLWLARITPPIAIGLALAQLVGAVAAPWWLLPVLVNAVIALTIGRGVNAEIRRVAHRQDLFRAYAEMFATFTPLDVAAPRLKRLHATLTAGGVRADEQMRRLERIIALEEVSHSIIYGVILGFTLYNVHVLWLLERWRRDAGRHARAWLAALGELEALAALATLRHDNPAWAFPTLLDAPAADGTVLAAEGLGHPLLPPAARVGNDVRLGPPGTFLLVTGSNMSGKSTLLRALGINAVLAQAGAPVCARALTLAPVAPLTSIRVQDSLEQGVSYFMAELRRLKTVVDEAERANSAPVPSPTGRGGPKATVQANGMGEDGAKEPVARTPFFLLDEILHGTNTAERQIAARRIIRHLLTLGCTGAVSTHDLTLAQASDLAAPSRPVYFTEQFTREADGRPQMRFDYTLRPGIAPSTNALSLMEIVGLPGAEDDNDGEEREAQEAHA